MQTLQRYNSWVDRMCAQHSKVPQVPKVFDDHRIRQARRTEPTRFAQQPPPTPYQKMSERFTPTSETSMSRPAPMAEEVSPMDSREDIPEAPATPLPRSRNPRHVQAQQEHHAMHHVSSSDFREGRRTDTASRQAQQRAEQIGQRRAQVTAATNTRLERKRPAASLVEANREAQKRREFEPGKDVPRAPKNLQTKEKTIHKKDHRERYRLGEVLSQPPRPDTFNLKEGRTKTRK